MTNHRRCHHVCACGAILICPDAEHCAVGKAWDCPTCLQDQFDAFLSQPALPLTTTAPKPEQEPTHHEGH